MRRAPRFRWLVMLLGAGLVAGGALGVSHLRPARADEQAPLRAAADGGDKRQHAALPHSAAAGAAMAEKVAERSFVRGALFAYVERPANAAALERDEPAPAQWLRYVAINPAVVRGKESPFWKAPEERRLVLPLPDGRNLAVLIAQSRMLAAERFVATGTIEGRPGSQVVFASADGVLQMAVTDPEWGRFTLRQFADGTAQFFAVDPNQIAACGGALSPASVSVLGRRVVAAATAAPGGGETVHSAAASASAEAPVIRVMMLYSQAVITSLVNRSVVTSTFDLAIESMNEALAASGIDARVELARVAQVTYDETASAGDKVQHDALVALASAADGKMDEVPTWRDEVGADLVCLALRRGDQNSSGLGFLLGTPGDVRNADYGFSVVEFGSIKSSDLVPHELGHNFGCAHDREHSDNQGAFSYSYGYRFTGRNGRQYRTIMAYAPGERIGYYSNPRITAPSPIGVPLGIEAGQSGEADNARTIQQTAFEVANYRLGPAASAGTLVNVSTRGYVSEGERQLIGGIVVGGTEPKRVLVRAVGPALAALGVAQPAADPRLTLFRLGAAAQVLAENDNWEEQVAPVTADEVAATAAAVGAYPLSERSRDAALLVTLAPGFYTLNVTGAGGGEALVEAYETGGDNGRLVNLSTRGYVDKGREMIGGFVIAGEPGERKRVLVRVLGPSLEAHGVKESLYDPCLTLYNRENQALLFNDDWSADAQETVDTHAEKEIAATGFAPVNRREPAVLLDLAPGVYTVVVQPFERLPDQVAQPGVALVEVYEIGP